MSMFQYRKFERKGHSVSPVVETSQYCSNC